MKSSNPILRAFFLTALLSSCLLAQTPADVSTYPNPNLLPGKGPTNVWDGLAKTWAKRHQAWAGHETADHGSLGFLGDSITQGFDPLSSYFPGLKVANRGIGGDTTRGVLYRLDSDVLALDPDGVVLLIGTNDIGIGADPDDVVDNIKAILARLKAHNAKMPIIVCLVMPSSGAQHRPADKIKKLNAAIAQAIQGDDQVHLCDTWNIYADEHGDSPAALFPDHLHPNKEGYEKWVAALQPILAKLNLSHS
jgi:lysophospholipase L1-like esterase